MDFRHEAHPQISVLVSHPEMLNPNPMHMLAFLSVIIWCLSCPMGKLHNTTKPLIVGFFPKKNVAIKNASIIYSRLSKKNSMVHSLNVPFKLN